MARGRHPVRINIDPPSEQVAAKYLLRWVGRDLHHEPHRFPGLTSPDLFGNEKPLEIDFGCGTGVLACNRARQFPHVNFLGIDLSQKPLYCAVRDAAGLGLDNIKFVRGNFNEMLPLLRPQTVAAAFYLLPNPPQDYHKERANHRRRNFLAAVHKSLVSGCRFYFATDSNAFFQCVRTILEQDLKLDTTDLQLASSDISTGYLNIWLEKGRCVKGLVVEKLESISKANHEDGRLP